MVHFGLGSEKAIRSIEVRWPNGVTRTITEPAINRWPRLGREN